MTTSSYRVFGNCFFLIPLLGVLCCWGGDAAKPAPQGQAAAPTASKMDIPTTGVRSITLPTLDSPTMPSGPGEATFMSACVLCHTPRYVLTQPKFPKKTWVAEVDKMKKTFGAPISDEQIEPLVNYLVAIRGNGQ